MYQIYEIESQMERRERKGSERHFKNNGEDFLNLISINAHTLEAQHIPRSLSSKQSNVDI